MITYSNLTGIDENTARRVLVAARDIAPGVDLLEGEPAKDAAAILIAVAREAIVRGNRHVSSQGVGTARVGYFDMQAAFTAEDRSSLRSLVRKPSSGGHPVGSFPTARPFKGVWPDEDHR